MRKICLLITLLISVTATLWSQDAWLQPADWTLSEPSRYSVSNAKGNPELFDNYLPGIIYMKKGRVINKVSLNLFNEDDLVVSKPYKGVEALYDIEENDILYFEIAVPNQSTRTFLRLDKDTFNSSYAKTGFYEVMSEDKAFLKRSYKEFKKAEKVGGYSGGQLTDEFVLITQYYLKDSASGKYKDIKLSKKSISKVLGDQAAEAKNIMKQNRLKWNNEAHIALLLEKLQLP